MLARAVFVAKRVSVTVTTISYTPPASPLVVSYCAGDLVVDAAASTGGGGRALSFEWNVDDDSATQVDSTAIILRYPLSNRPEWNLDPDVEIEDQYIDPFNVRVTATNWLGSSKWKLIRIEPTQLAVPNVYIDCLLYTSPSPRDRG